LIPDFLNGIALGPVNAGIEGLGYLKRVIVHESFGELNVLRLRESTEELLDIIESLTLKVFIMTSLPVLCLGTNFLNDGLGVQLEVESLSTEDEESNENN